MAAASEAQGVAVGNPGWIAPFVTAGVKVIGDYGLNLYNSADFMLARELGIKEAVVSHEAEPGELSALDFHGVIPEVAVGGRIPVMISEHCLTGDYLKDRKGQYYPILTDPSHCRSMILSHKETGLTNFRDKMKKAGLNRFRIYVWQ